MRWGVGKRVENNTILKPSIYLFSTIDKCTKYVDGQIGGQRKGCLNIFVKLQKNLRRKIIFGGLLKEVNKLLYKMSNFFL
jgi:hypothetical protein